MKKTLLAVALTTIALGSTLANASDNKHLYVSVNAPVYRSAPHVYHGGNYHAPRYTAPRYHAPRYHQQHRGHWHNGRWVAPVVVGATIGALAIAASSPVYAAPAPVYYNTPVNYYTPGDRFSFADANNDGYLSYYEARNHGNLHRNFSAIDWNGDGYLSRDEVNGWRHHW